MTATALSVVKRVPIDFATARGQAAELANQPAAGGSENSDDRDVDFARHIVAREIRYEVDRAAQLIALVHRQRMPKIKL